MVKLVRLKLLQYLKEKIRREADTLSFELNLDFVPTLLNKVKGKR